MLWVFRETINSCACGNESITKELSFLGLVRKRLRRHWAKSIFLQLGASKENALHVNANDWIRTANRTIPRSLSALQVSLPLFASLQWHLKGDNSLFLCKAKIWTKILFVPMHGSLKGTVFVGRRHPWRLSEQVLSLFFSKTGASATLSR